MSLADLNAALDGPSECPQPLALGVEFCARRDKT